MEPGLLLWILFAAMTAAAVLVVLLPLARGRAAPPSEAADAAVYRDQLAELERERAAGVIGVAEAEAARAEIARRFLRATDAARAAAPGHPRLRKVTAVAVILAVPLVTLGLYSALGSPDLPGRPLAARLEGGADTGDLPAMIARIERHLVEEPDDIDGWRLLTPVYMQLGAFDRAANGFRQILRLEGPLPDTQTRLGEALVLAANGEIGDEARGLFEAALAGDPASIAARFYLARAYAAAGRQEEALALLDTALAGAPADAPWRGELAGLRASIAGTEPVTPPTTQADVIAGMVSGLAARLEANPDDGEGWRMLVRSYVVLERRPEALAALERGRSALSADPAALAALDAVAGELGLGEGQPQ